MTQKEELITTFRNLGIPFNDELNTVDGEICMIEETETGDRQYMERWNSSITITEGCGYRGFITLFYFDKDDNFIAHGCWE